MSYTACLNFFILPCDG